MFTLSFGNDFLMSFIEKLENNHLQLKSIPHYFDTQTCLQNKQVNATRFSFSKANAEVQSVRRIFKERKMFEVVGGSQTDLLRQEVSLFSCQCVLSLGRTVLLTRWQT
jgi:hypothetical protein